MALKINEIFHVGVAMLSSAVDSVTNSILIQLGSISEKYNFADKAEQYQQIGFYSRPSKPVDGKSAAQCLAIKSSGRDIVFASTDKRDQAIYGNLSDGETVVYASGPNNTAQAKVKLRNDGSITLMTTADNTPTGLGVMLQLSPTGLSFSAPWGSFNFDATGFHVKTLAGPRIDMGGINVPGVPSAVSSAISGYANITAPSVNVNGSVVTLGAGPAYQPVVNFPSAALLVPVPGVSATFGPGTLSPSVRVSVT